MDVGASFGQWVALRRKALRLNRSDLAQQVGCAAVTIRKIEEDERRPSQQLAECLAEHLAVSSEERAAFVEAARGERGVDRLSPPDRLDMQLFTLPARRHDNLPIPPTSLIGRAREVAALQDSLLRADVRLLTLVGAPGIGKTRLAIHVAMEVGHHFRHGVCFVALAPISDPALVGTAIAQALDVVIIPTLSPNEGVKRYLRNKQMLLVLDNFEHVITAAPVISEILAASLEVKVLVTSRAAVNLSGENRFSVPPLALPDAQHMPMNTGFSPAMAGSPAVELFVQRAVAIMPAFELNESNARAVAEICIRLDGSPLAIELAAPRLTIFAPQQLLARLSHRLDVLTSGASDLPARQRTLRGTIDWSYDLLSPEEQALFRRLGVFVGSWALDAVERVASEGLTTPVADLLQALVGKSLVQVKIEERGDEVYYSLLETLREYALKRLSANGEQEAIAKRYAEYFIEYAESIEPKLNSAEQLTWLRHLDRDGDHLRAALAYARHSNDVALQVRFVAALWPWLLRTPDPEHWAWLPELFAKASGAVARHTHAKALYGAGFLLSYFARDLAQVRAMFEEGANLFKDLGDALWQARCLARLGCRAWFQADFAQARDYCQQSAALAVQAGDAFGIADALQWLAAVERDQGNYDQAAELYKQSLNRFRELNNKLIEGNVLNGMGDLAFNRGDCVEAQICYEGALVAWREGGVLVDPQLRGVGRIAYVQGELARADSILEECVANLRHWVSPQVLSWTLHHLGIVKHLLGDDTRATALLREAITLQQRLRHRITMPESLERFAWVAADQHHPQRAARLLGAVAALRKGLGLPLPLGDKPLYDHYLEATRALLEGEDFMKAWAKGATMSLDQAVEYALSED